MLSNPAGLSAQPRHPQSPRRRNYLRPPIRLDDTSIRVMRLFLFAAFLALAPAASAQSPVSADAQTFVVSGLRVDEADPPPGQRGRAGRSDARRRHLPPRRLWQTLRARPDDLRRIGRLRSDLVDWRAHGDRTRRDGLRRQSADSHWRRASTPLFTTPRESESVDDPPQHAPRSAPSRRVRREPSTWSSLR